MKRAARTLAVSAGACVVLISGSLVWLGFARPNRAERSFTIEAQKYGYSPAVIKVNKGDRATIRLKARDVTHGFYLEGYDIDAKARPEMPSFWVRRPSTNEDYRTVNEIAFVANREGKFRYRCSVTCGYMHPFMQGELIVEPNRLFPVSILLSVSVTALSLLWFARPETDRTETDVVRRP